MNPCRTLLVLFASLSVVTACSKKSDDRKEAPPPSQPPQEQTEKKKEPAESSPAKKKEESAQKAPSQSEHQNAPSRVSTNSQDYHEDQPFYKKEYDHLKGNLAKAAEYMGEVGDKAAGLGKDIHGATLALIAPGAREELRKESLDTIHEQSDERRDKKLGDLKEALASSRAASATRVNQTLRPNDEVTQILASLVTETDLGKAQDYSTMLVDEIFNEPDLARAKVMKLQLGLRRLSEGDLYNQDVANRIAYVQAQLDDRVRADGSADLLKDSLFIAGTSLALGAFAGFHGIEGTRRFVHEFSPKTAVKSAAEGVGSAVRNTRERVASLFRRATAADEATLPQSGLRRTLAKIPLSSEEVVRRDIVALGLAPDLSKDLALQKVPRSAVGFQDFKATNIPGLKYTIVDQWDNVDLGDVRRIIFAVSRLDHLNPRPVMVASRRITKQETDAVIKEIEFKAPQEGGPEFVVVVNPETGVATSSRLTTKDFDEMGSVMEEGVQQQARSGKSVVEAQVDGDLPIPAPSAKPEQVISETSATVQQVATGEVSEEVAAATAKPGLFERAQNVAQDVAEKTRQTADQVVETTSQFAQKTANTVKPALKNFDVPWATAVTLGSAVPLYGVFMQGYDGGRRYGEGREVLYLESLIPQEQMQKVVAERNDQAQRK